MKWSFSAARMFQQCPRRWYYSQFVANPTSKDLFRRETYLLNQLRTVYAWRGCVVDKVIEKLILPRAKANNLPTEDEVKTFSTSLMDKQLEFGNKKKYRCQGMRKSDESDTYCAFFEVEYDGGLQDKLVRQAREDVMISLHNLMQSNFLVENLKSCSYAAAQRSLTFQFWNTAVRCTPDLIVFFPDLSPLIIDWKVHSFPQTDSWLQLGLYAIALSRTKLYKDFPRETKSQLENPTAFRLVEYQLLANRIRDHSISNSDIAEIEDFIFESSIQMNNITNGKKFKQLNVDDFQTAYSSNVCSKCRFKKICWRTGWFEPY